MNESSGDWTDPSTMRERELELEVARLQAELEAANGMDAGDAASRFLTLAASTVDAALADARREADELVAEVTADAEARRDEATRLAAEAEARADAMRSEAENHESIVTAAHDTAGQIRSDAETEAANLIATERARVVEEIESLSEVREALEGEREALESYHGELRRRVQELAESMVIFMTTEPPIAATAALEELISPEELTAPEELAAEEAIVDVPLEQMVEEVTSDGDPIDADISFEVPVTDFAADPDAAAPTALFGGAPIVDDTEEAETSAEDEVFDILDEVPPAPVAPSAGLFSRATEEESTGEGSALFGEHGFRLLQQTDAEELAAALGHEDEADAAFESFLAGDSDSDPSRDWLLRNDQA